MRPTTLLSIALLLTGCNHGENNLAPVEAPDITSAIVEPGHPERCIPDGRMRQPPTVSSTSQIPTCPPLGGTGGTWCEVDLNEGIGIHGASILAAVEDPRDITFGWLSEQLHVPLDEIWPALALTRNADFVAALYRAQAAQWGHAVVDPNAAWASPFVSSDASPPPTIPMPELPASQLEALAWLELGRQGTENWFDWRVPNEDLWLPNHATRSGATHVGRSGHERHTDPM